MAGLLLLSHSKLRSVQGAVAGLKSSCMSCLGVNMTLRTVLPAMLWPNDWWTCVWSPWDAAQIDAEEASFSTFCWQYIVTAPVFKFVEVC